MFVRTFSELVGSLVAWAGCSRSRWVWGLQPNNSSAGEHPVEVCGVFRYWNRKRASRVSRSPLVFCNASLNVCTALSARPLLDRWYGEHVECLKPTPHFSLLERIMRCCQPCQVNRKAPPPAPMGMAYATMVMTTCRLCWPLSGENIHPAGRCPLKVARDRRGAHHLL